MAGDGQSPGPVNRPFAHLASRWRARPERRRRTQDAAAPPEPGTPSRAPDADAADLFTRAMDGVAPLAAEARERVDGPPPAARESRAPVDEEAEALATLSELVTGEVRFDVSDTAEYLEGAVAGLDPRLLRRLRRGDFAWQAHLDLHGMAAAPAREAVRRFLEQCLRAGHRCVLVVHGRGRNSKDGEPVLKRRLVSWLSRGAVGRMVLAFCSARPHDGGPGALYVLLRRDRRKRPVRVTEGSPGT
jgi:DNA-nicking Smr family endonuclease